MNYRRGCILFTNALIAAPPKPLATIQRIVDEITMANTLLEVMDGKTQRTFAYPCGDMKAGDSSYVDKIKGSFIAARGAEGKMQKTNEIDLYNIGCYIISGQSGYELIGLEKKRWKIMHCWFFFFMELEVNII